MIEQLAQELAGLSVSRIRQVVAKYNKHLKISGHSGLDKEALIGHILQKSNLDRPLMSKLLKETTFHKASSRSRKEPQIDLYSYIGERLKKEGFPKPQAPAPAPVQGPRNLQRGFGIQRFENPVQGPRNLQRGFGIQRFETPDPVADTEPESAPEPPRRPEPTPVVAEDAVISVAPRATSTIEQATGLTREQFNALDPAEAFGRFLPVLAKKNLLGLSVASEDPETGRLVSKKTSKPQPVGSFSEVKGLGTKVGSYYSVKEASSKLYSINDFLTRINGAHLRYNPSRGILYKNAYFDEKYAFEVLESLSSGFFGNAIQVYKKRDKYKEKLKKFSETEIQTKNKELHEFLLEMVDRLTDETVLYSGEALRIAGKILKASGIDYTRGFMNKLKRGSPMERTDEVMYKLQQKNKKEGGQSIKGSLMEIEQFYNKTRNIETKYYDELASKLNSLYDFDLPLKTGISVIQNPRTREGGIKEGENLMGKLLMKSGRYQSIYYKVIKTTAKSNKLELSNEFGDVGLHEDPKKHQSNASNEKLILEGYSIVEPKPHFRGDETDKYENKEVYENDYNLSIRKYVERVFQNLSKEDQEKVKASTNAEHILPRPVLVYNPDGAIQSRNKVKLRPYGDPDIEEYLDVNVEEHTIINKLPKIEHERGSGYKTLYFYEPAWAKFAPRRNKIEDLYNLKLTF